MIDPLADGEPIYYLLLFTEFVESFFSPKVDFLRVDPIFYVFCIFNRSFYSKVNKEDLLSDPAKSTIFRKD